MFWYILIYVYIYKYLLTKYPYVKYIHLITFYISYVVFITNVFFPFCFARWACGSGTMPVGRLNMLIVCGFVAAVLAEATWKWQVFFVRDQRYIEMDAALLC